MNELTKIMAAIDLSEFSPSVMEYAGALCQKTGAELVIVNVINQRELEAIKTVQIFAQCKILEEDVIKRQKAERTDQIRALVDRCDMEDVTTRIVFRVGIPFEQLIRAVQDESAQLLVMGPKGRGNVPGVRFGSAAEKMFRHCPVPLLSVRGELHPHETA
jgi:nucleotide-binding universal stress UspA family protein